MAMNLKLIKNETQYQESLSALESLMIDDPMADSQESNLIEVLSLLIENYENEHVELDSLDPVEAIKFRMEQSDLDNKSLIPFIGSSSKVSEVLNGKRPLSINMVKSLHNGLGIPYESLMGEQKSDVTSDITIDWTLFPLKEMLKRGVFKSSLSFSDIKEQAEACMRQFFGPRINETRNLLLRTSANSSTRSARQMNGHSLSVWHELILKRASEIDLEHTFDIEQLTDEYFNELAELSVFDDGPTQAVEQLNQSGIRVIFESHFTKTYLDGAAIKLEDESPVIAMTLRHDRLDNFWFVLLHELAHVKLHLYSNTDNITVFYDDLEVDVNLESIEREADEFASRILVPDAAWDDIVSVTTAAEVRKYSRKHKRSPSILAGRLRKQRNNYRIFNALIGRNEVREYLM